MVSDTEMLKKLILIFENGHIDRDTENSIRSQLVAALFKFRFDEQEVYEIAFFFEKMDI